MSEGCAFETVEAASRNPVGGLGARVDCVRRSAIKGRGVAGLWKTGGGGLKGEG